MYKENIASSYSFLLSLVLFPVTRAEADQAGPGLARLGLPSLLSGLTGRASNFYRESYLQRAVRASACSQTSRSSCNRLDSKHILTYQPLGGHTGLLDLQSFHVMVVPLWMLASGWIQVLI